MPLRACIRAARPARRWATTRFALPPKRLASQASQAAAAPGFSIVDTCPSPTCACAATPELSEGLEIDHKTPINGLISSYAQQVLVCTGKDDWPSRIEEDNSGDNLAADLRELVGRGGPYNDVSR